MFEYMASTVPRPPSLGRAVGRGQDWIITNLFSFRFDHF